MERLIELMGLAGDDEIPATWADALPKNFTLPPPSPQNIAEFLGVLDSWVNGALHAVGALERVSLELLVEAEAHVSQAYLNQTEGGVSPEPPAVPKRYPTLARGQERSRQKRLGWWDRFQTADGFFPSAARFVVAGAILAGVLGFGGTIGHPTLTVFNGLGLPVVVEVQGHRLELEPQAHERISLDKSKRLRVTALSRQGLPLQSFQESVEGSLHYVYNVVGAAPLVEWTAVYGNTSSEEPRELGAPVWFVSRADLLFEEPPKSLSSSSKGGRKTVVSAFPSDSPYRMLSHAKANERSHMLEMHTTWDEPSSRHLMAWLAAARDESNAAQLIQERLRRYPDDMSALRLEQDVAPPADKRTLCERTRTKSRLQPQNLDLSYLSLRCADDDDQPAVEQLVAAHRQHPEHPYLANAAGHELMRRRDYAGATSALESAAHATPLLDSASLELARLARIGGTATASRIRALAANSSSLASLLALENGETQDGPERAVSLLARGELDNAVATARPEPGLFAMILQLAAASDGASPTLVNEALASPDQLRAGPAMWATIALLAREQRPHAALDALALKQGAFAPPLLEFADAAFLRGAATAVEAKLWKLPAALQPQACVMALVRVGAAAPTPCRELAKAALFASERPYFR
jgi:hypothetical protein